MTNHYHTYLETDIVSADPIRLIELLYRGAIAAVSGARRHLRDGDIPSRSRQLSKAMGIVHELVRSLNPEAGGAMAAELLALYRYILDRLAEGNFKQSDPPLADAQSLLHTLLEGWSSIRTAEAVSVEPSRQKDAHTVAPPAAVTLAAAGLDNDGLDPVVQETVRLVVSC